ncbi:reverse transcriptase [Plakobranchus ocellatus]|uniref:Reverse transcriptase n=1 Tax=Plakobranchus ocellatus TaxID=259542 RepID=A0AAV3YYY2_9GAST|nr:reverse transcriptase [Plakobranchus ocellatus]
MKDDPTCLLCHGKQTTEHIFRFCKVALSQGWYTWRHNMAIQGLAIAMCDAKDLPIQPNARVLVFSSEDGTKSWRDSSASIDAQRESLLYSVTTGNCQPTCPNGKKKILK